MLASRHLPSHNSDRLSGQGTCDNAQYLSVGYEFCLECSRSWNTDYRLNCFDLSGFPTKASSYSSTRWNTFRPLTSSPLDKSRYTLGVLDPSWYGIGSNRLRTVHDTEHIKHNDEGRMGERESVIQQPSTRCGHDKSGDISNNDFACGPVRCMACTSPLPLSFFPPLDLLLFTI